jgi:hypothetical protein
VSIAADWRPRNVAAGGSGRSGAAAEDVAYWIPGVARPATSRVEPVFQEPRRAHLVGCSYAILATLLPGPRTDDHPISGANVG